MEPLSLISGKRIKDTIFDLTFGEYVELALGDFSVLKPTTDVTESEASETRQLILAQFAEATGDHSFIASMQTTAKRMKLSLKLMSLNVAMKALEVSYSEETLVYLIETRVLPKDTQYPSTGKELDVILSRIQSEISLTKLDLAEVDALEEKAAGDQKQRTPDDIRMSFVKLIASVSQYVKFNVSYDTNCAVVAEYVNRLIKYQAEQQAKETT